MTPDLQKATLQGRVALLENLLAEHDQLLERVLMNLRDGSQDTLAVRTSLSQLICHCRATWAALMQSQTPTSGVTPNGPRLKLAE